jgi:hypothetical protein
MYVEMLIPSFVRNIGGVSAYNSVEFRLEVVEFSSQQGGCVIAKVLLTEVPLLKSPRFEKTRLIKCFAASTFDR